MNFLSNPNLKRKGSFLFLLLYFSCTFSKQPAYFIFGVEQFKGLQIYDMIQDNEKNYWFSTNEGIFHYDYYHYEKIECAEAKSKSVFNFVMNEEGTIYCYNLNKQVFEIKNRKCQLFYELKNNETGPNLSMAIADNGNLVIGGDKITILNKNGIPINRYELPNHHFGEVFKTDSRELEFHLSGIDSIVVYSKGTFRLHKLVSTSGNFTEKGFLQFFTLKNQNYAINLRSKALFLYKRPTFELTPIPSNSLFSRTGSVRIYETGNHIWVAGTLPGVAMIRELNSDFSGSVFFENFFISNVFINNEGSILLSTFNHGIIVIPDVKIPDVNHSFSEDPITSIYADASIGMVFGSSKGKLMNFEKGNARIINKKGTRPIDALFGDSLSDLILFDDGLVRAYNRQNGQILDICEASLKCAAFKSNYEFYIGTNTGVKKILWDGKINFTIQIIEGMKDRTYALAYHPADQYLYASTTEGLYVLLPSGSIKKIVYEQGDLYPVQLLINDGKIYAVTEKNGVLVIEKDRVINKIQFSVNGNPIFPDKIILHKQVIVAKSKEGLFEFGAGGEFIKSIPSLYGFSSRTILDFTFQNEMLWVSHSGGIQQIDLQYSNPDSIAPTIRFDKILVNDEAINFSVPFSFSSDHQKIQFVFSYPTLRNRETNRYHFKLEGYDKFWNVNDYESNDITYNALAPGEYSFLVKAENQGAFSEVISYSFSIPSPYYLRGWFILTGILSFLMIVYFMYRWQLNIQRKKSSQLFELNASKLTAIQSQMNPHFIFNSLNSIQDLILKGDVEHSYSYITTFSNLVRRTLDYSDKDFIDFEQEIQLLELYLSLEKLRFKKALNYEINFSNIDDILLPPLLIQPFIENALVHGLLHKEGEKKLKITFELNEVLICRIEDNGVGREKAKAIKQRQRAEHESFSGKAIRNRFEILSNVFKGQFGYSYEDLFQNGEPCGTRVTLTIPIKHKF